MNALYQYGYQQAKSGRAWHKTPPSLETPTMVLYSHSRSVLP